MQCVYLKWRSLDLKLIEHVPVDLYIDMINNHPHHTHDTETFNIPIIHPQLK